MENTVQNATDAIAQKQQMQEAVKTMMENSMYNNNELVRNLNRVEGFDPGAHMIALKEDWGDLYLDVAFRTLWFRLANPTGKIETKIVQLSADMATFEARVYTDRNDPEDACLANSHGQRGASDGAGFLEWAETAAIGRALFRAGYGCQFSDLGSDDAPNRSAANGADAEVKGSFDGKDGAVVTTTPAASAPATTTVPDKPPARKRTKRSSKGKGDTENTVSSTAEDMNAPIEGQITAKETAAAVVQGMEANGAHPTQTIQQCIPVPPPAPVQAVEQQAIEATVEDAPAKQQIPTQQVVAGQPAPVQASPILAVATPAPAGQGVAAQSQPPAAAPAVVAEQPVAQMAQPVETAMATQPAPALPAIQLPPVAPIVTPVAPAEAAATVPPVAAPVVAPVAPPVPAAAAPAVPESPALQVVPLPIAPDVAGKFAPDMSVEDIMTVMTLDDAKAVMVDFGKNNGRTMAEISVSEPASLGWYVSKYDGRNNLIRASANLLLQAGLKYGQAG